MGKRYIPGYLSRRAKRESTGAGAAVFAAGLVLLVLLLGAAIGRYQRQLKSDSSFRAEEFYFTSDFLNGGIHTLAPPVSGGSTEVSFTLGNHADDLRVSEVEIEYEVMVEPAGAAVTYADTSRKLGSGTAEDDTVTIAGLRPGVTYTVTATGRGGYEKSLTATIEVLSNEAQIYQYKEATSEYTLLTVWNEGEEAGDVTIAYTGIPDNTNPNMEDWSAGAGTAINKTVAIGPHESRVFRFFGGGTVTVTNAEEKVPN